MGQNLMSAELKSRVDPAVKLRLEQIAANRELDLSDVVREALRQYLQRQPVPTVTVPHGEVAS